VLPSEPNANLVHGALNQTFSGTSFNIGIANQLSDHLILKANVGRGYRAPSISEIASNGLDPGARIVYVGNKNFVPFLQWLRHNYGHQIDKILITTNGSATYKYYNKLLDCVDNISFSVHSEYIDEKKFFDTVLNLHRNLPTGKHIHVCIMDEYWNVDRIKLYQQLLTNHNISHNVNQINYSVQTRSHPIMKGKLNLANT
jgi:hypothetical protein